MLSDELQRFGFVHEAFFAEARDVKTAVFYRELAMPQTSLYEEIAATMILSLKRDGEASFVLGIDGHCGCYSERLAKSK